MPIPDDHANFAFSTINAAPSPPLTGANLTVNTGDGALFPTPPFNATVWAAGESPGVNNAEIIRVTAIAGDTFTILRAEEGSNARAILVGDQIDNSITVKTLTDIEGSWLVTPLGGAISGTTLLDLQGSWEVLFTGATATAPVTYTVANAQPGAAFLLQSIANGHTITHPTGTKWPAGTPPTPTGGGGEDLYGYLVLAVNLSSVPTALRGTVLGQAYA